MTFENPRLGGEAVIISVVSEKGGVGKSTLSVNIASAFATRGKKVLLIDSDDQTSSMDWLTSRPDNIPRIIGTQLLGANLRKQAPVLAEDYDVTIIDCKGLVSEMAKAAIVISDFFVVPIAPGLFDLRATERFIENTIADVSTYKDTKGAILLNMIDTTLFSRQIERYVRELNFPVFDSTITRYCAHKEALSQGLSVSEYAPKDKASLEFTAFFHELCAALGVDDEKGFSNKTKKRIAARKPPRNNRGFQKPTA